MTQESTHAAKVMDVTKGQIRCDAAAKQVLSNKDILAIILREVVPEFKNCDKDFIKRECLKDGVRVDLTPPDGDDATDTIVGLNTDEVLLLEGRKSYDLLFEVLVPEENVKRPGRKKRKGARNAAASGKEAASSSDEPEKVVLIVHLEIQQNTSPGYSLEKRAIFYNSLLMVKQQLLVKNFSYKKMRKVYSVWVCLNPKNETQNCIYSLKYGPCGVSQRTYKKKKRIYVDESEKRLKKITEKNDYDMSEIIFIHVPNYFPDDEKPVIKMLGTLFSRQKTVAERKKILENEFGVAMTKNLGEGIDTMCNIGEALFKEGEAKGKAKGKAEGIKIGEKKGEKRGEKKGIVKTLLRAIVSNVKHYGVTNEQAMANLGIPENEYEKYNKLLEKEGLALT
ncbi:hypothetical protein [Succinimonas sp.]|uniref:hypothetical protein n=1 Tax=Succinimonas sp. TaxID=1936151 RepID=UPI0038702CDA